MRGEGTSALVMLPCLALLLSACQHAEEPAAPEPAKPVAVRTKNHSSRKKPAPEAVVAATDAPVRKPDEAKNTATPVVVSPPAETTMSAAVKPPSDTTPPAPGTMKTEVVIPSSTATTTGPGDARASSETMEEKASRTGVASPLSKYELGKSGPARATPVALPGSAERPAKAAVKPAATPLKLPSAETTPAGKTPSTSARLPTSDDKPRPEGVATEGTPSLPVAADAPTIRGGKIPLPMSLSAWLADEKAHEEWKRRQLEKQAAADAAREAERRRLRGAIDRFVLNEKTGELERVPAEDAPKK